MGRALCFFALVGACAQRLDLGGGSQPDGGMDAAGGDAGRDAMPDDAPLDSRDVAPDAAGDDGSTDAGEDRDASDGAPSDADAARDATVDAPDASSAPLGQVLEAALGRAHTCARLEDGTFACIGANDFHQSGATENGGATCAPCVQQAIHVTAGTLTALRAGGDTTCVIREGRVACVGRNSFGQLGRGLPDENPHAGFVDVGPTGVTDLALGHHHVCIVHGGSVSCAGLGHAGQLGSMPSGTCAVPADVALEEGLSGELPCAATFVLVPGLVGAASLQIRRHTTCVTHTDGAVTCFGDATPLPGTLASPLAPTDMSVLDGVAFAVGWDHGAQLVDGRPSTWGAHRRGQLGFGGIPPALCDVDRCASAVPLIDAPSGSQIVTGDGYTCLHVAAEDVRCWGTHEDGRLGISTPGGLESCGGTPCSQTPRSVYLMDFHEGLVSLIAGDRHACGISENRNLICWGRNDRAQIGRHTGPASEAVRIPSYVYGL